MNIMVRVRLYALLRDYHPGPDNSNPFSVTVPIGTTVTELAELLKLPNGLLRNAFVNNAACELDTCLKDSDSISLFPPVSGGNKQIFF